MFSPNQSKAARALLSWSQTDLADAAGLGLSTIKDYESGRRKPHNRNLSKIDSAFSERGIEFLSAQDGSQGVRLCA
ncbi:MAG: helix-turn-helix transcriptional regulator [Alphaproteobacteria bacterium]|nr:helix-turn-helix transcriptional regulator [Alphaproteobacteria bacterium]